ncbi:MAG: LysR family transcriptional regulator [Proteobacteria bacterium]|jgi:DNA-binding transcriptional LysR family regulator|nr:LysR family transcriptional regulator [Pseudomonadota bacterium]
MDQLSLLNTFVRVAERGSFSAVARDFSTSQPVISRQIAALEDQLGVRLIQRTTRRLSLTEDGQVYLDHARAVVEAMDAAQASVGVAQKTPTGQVRLGVPTSVGMYLAARLPEFFARYPEMSVDLKMRDGAFDLVEEGLDLVISVAEATQASVITRTIGSAASVLVASPAYLAARGKPATPQDLLDHECIVYTRPGIDRNWRFFGKGIDETVTVHGRFHADSSEAVRRAARAGLGIAMLPRLTTIDDVNSGRLVTLLDAFCPMKVKVYAILPSRRYIPPRTRAIMEFLIAEFETTPFLQSTAGVAGVPQAPIFD